MKKVIISLLFTLTFVVNTNAQDVWKSSHGTVSFFSSAPLEDIFAESKKFSGAINTKTNTVAVFVKINTMEMENKLQQEHFNEKYMESEKYPKASFKGKIDGDIDWKKNGKYTGNAVGTLELHGVALERTIPITISVKGGEFFVHSKFDVKVEDHKIKVPSLVFNKIAEVVEISLNATFIPYEKK